MMCYFDAVKLNYGLHNLNAYCKFLTLNKEYLYLYTILWAEIYFSRCRSLHKELQSGQSHASNNLAKHTDINT